MKDKLPPHNYNPEAESPKSSVWNSAIDEPFRYVRRVYKGGQIGDAEYVEELVTVIPGDNLILEKIDPFFHGRPVKAVLQQTPEEKAAVKIVTWVMDGRELSHEG